MNLTSVLKDLATAEGVPDEALNWAREHWDVVGPAAKQVLARCARDPEHVQERDASTAYFLLHLAAELGDKSFLPGLTAVARFEGAADLLFGDTLPITLGPVLISMTRDDPQALVTLADTPQTDATVRGAAFEAMAYQVAANRLSRETVIDCLGRFAGSHEDEPEADWMGWATAVALIADDGLLARAKTACEAGLVPDEWLDFDDITKLAEAARAPDAGVTVCEGEDIRPFGNVVEEMTALQEMFEDADDEEGESEDEAESDEAETEPGASADAGTVTNPYRDVGRNDPCPCGSGKKFKKCHGAAGDD